jgi:hypothetical protein
MIKFYVAVIVSLIFLAGCKKDEDETVYPQGKIGEWTVYINDSTIQPIGGWNLILYRNGDSITGELCSEKLEGTIFSDSVIFRIGDSSDENAVIYRGKIKDLTITGNYSFLIGGGGTWSGTSGYIHHNYSRYYVFGGDVPTKFSDELGTHPERFGFQVMGLGKWTSTFIGDYPYYIILSYPDNTAKIDAVGSDGGNYFETYFTGHTYNESNIGTGPDGKCAILGKAALSGEDGPGGFVGIDASLVNHTLITIYICE